MSKKKIKSSNIKPVKACFIEFNSEIASSRISLETQHRWNEYRIHLNPRTNLCQWSLYLEIMNNQYIWCGTNSTILIMNKTNLSCVQISFYMQMLLTKIIYSVGIYIIFLHCLFFRINCLFRASISNSRARISRL